MRIVTLFAAPLGEMLPGETVSWHQLPDSAHAWADRQVLYGNEMITGLAGDYRAELGGEYEMLVVEMSWPPKNLTVAEWKSTYGHDGAPAEFAAELLRSSFSPGAFQNNHAMPADRKNSMWRGSDEALEKLGLSRNSPVVLRDLAEVVSGRSLRTGERVLPSGDVLDLVFKVPNSVSIVWSAGDGAETLAVEDAVLESAAVMVNHLVRQHPVVAGTRVARSFVAALVLHAVGTLSAEAQPIPPMLHVHCCLIGVLDAEGCLVVPDEPTVNDVYIRRESDAVGGNDLGNRLMKMGYVIDVTGGKGSRKFEIVGLPQGLLDSFDWENGAGCAVAAPYELDPYS